MPVPNIIDPNVRKVWLMNPSMLAESLRNKQSALCSPQPAACSKQSEARGSQFRKNCLYLIVRVQHLDRPANTLHS